MDEVDAVGANEGGQLMDIGEVASRNIVQALGLNQSDVPTVKQAIRDEIQAMSSHFTMAVSDAQFQMEQSVREIKSTYRYARDNVYAILGYSFAVFAVGFLLGKLL